MTPNSMPPVTFKYLCRQSQKRVHMPTCWVKFDHIGWNRLWSHCRWNCCLESFMKSLHGIGYEIHIIVWRLQWIGKIETYIEKSTSRICVPRPGDESAPHLPHNNFRHTDLNSQLRWNLQRINLNWEPNQIWSHSFTMINFKEIFVSIIPSGKESVVILLKEIAWYLVVLRWCCLSITCTH